MRGHKVEGEEVVVMVAVVGGESMVMAGEEWVEEQAVRILLNRATRSDLVITTMVDMERLLQH